jgi:hypothetical protein
MRQPTYNFKNLRSPWAFVLVATLTITCLSQTASAQSGSRGMMEDDNELKLTGQFQLEQDTRQGYLVLMAKIPEGSYIYSLTQKGNPPPSKIEIATSEAFQVSGTFKPELQPTVLEIDPDFGGRTEKHKKSLRFFIPLQLAENTNIDDLTIRLRFNGQVCSSEGTCMPINDKIIEAKFSGYFPRVAEQIESSRTVGR